MLTQANLFAHELEKLINSEIERIKDELSYDNTQRGIEDYKKYTGELSGLRKALEFIGEAAQIVDKRN